MASAQEKTEKPTSKKLGEARRKGQVAKSQEISTLAVLLAALAISVLTCKLIFQHFREMVVGLWGYGFPTGLDTIIDRRLLGSVSYHFMAMIAPFAVLCMIVGVLSNVVQLKGFLFSLESIQPDLGKLDLIKGLTRLLGTRSWVELAKSVIKISIVSYALYRAIHSDLDQFVLMVNQDLFQIMMSIGILAFKVVLYVCLAMIPVCFIDFYYQRWQHLRDLRMTKQEVKEEHKQSEGDPQVKSRIRSIQRSIARQRMLSDVSSAEVVITNPTHYAVALQYQDGMEAPKVVAKGMNLLAKKVIKMARKHGIPVVPNPPLARALYKQVDVGNTIPVSLYKAVAKVLAYIYQQRGQMG